VAYLVLAFAQLAREGLGPERSRVDLTGVAQLDTNGREAEFAYPKVPAPLALDLAPDAPTTRVRVEFLTPTELKSGQQLAARRFAVVEAVPVISPVSLSALPIR